MTNINISTKTKTTWCPGCYNFQILAGFKKFIEGEITKGKKKDNFAMVTGIGCHAKMFDYIGLNGLNGLHGRVLPACLGIKVAKPSLDVFGFAGDGDAFSEGISHLIHAARYNSNFTYLVHNNQVFALTVGQPTPTTEKGFTDKTTPQGVKNPPLNPIKLMLAAGCGFVARVFADVKQIEWILNEAKKHKGFKFIEIIQPCIIFHADKNYKQYTQSLEELKHDSSSFEKAMQKANEWDYDGVKEKDKINLGIFYKKVMPAFEEKY